MAFNPRLDKLKDRKFFLEMYIDSDNHDYKEVIEKAIKDCDRYAYIVHDKDVNEDGEIKKPHVHMFVRYYYQRSRTSVAVDIGLPLNLVEYSLSEKQSVRYELHADDINKHQYSIEEIISNYDISKFFAQGIEQDYMYSKAIFEFINCHPRCTFTDVVNYALSEDAKTTKCVMKNAYFWRCYINDCYKASLKDE